MLPKLTILILLFLTSFSRINPEPDAFKTSLEMARNHNYTIESHEIPTPDGFMHTIFRIPSKTPPTSPSPKKPAILLQHGCFQSSDAWLDNGIYSPAYSLSERGYDVWLGNIRGNRYSRHSNSSYFQEHNLWNYSVQDIGLLDTRPTIQYILNYTGNEKLAYVAYSQGNTQIFAAMSIDPVFFKQRVSAVFSIAPVLRFGGRNYLFVVLACLRVENIFTYFGVKQFFPYTYELSRLLYAVVYYFKPFGRFLTQLVSDGEGSLYNDEKLPVLFSHFPDGPSMKIGGSHFQNLREEEFGHDVVDDHETEKFEKYNLRDIPDIPIGMACGKIDKVAELHNSRWMRDELEAIGVLKMYNEYDKMGHVAFNIPDGSFESLQYLFDAGEFLDKYAKPKTYLRQ